MTQATLKDIASVHSVSESLVSRVLSGRMGKVGVSPELKDAIGRTADELGYRPNLSASALARGKHGAIAVSIHRMGIRSSGLAEDMAVGISEEAARQRQRLWVRYIETDDEFLAAASEVRRSGVDGWLVAGVEHTNMTTHLADRTKKGLPIVTIHPEALSAGIVNVGCSELSVARVAITHLCECGCTRMVQLGPDVRRREGFNDALAATGLAVDLTMDIMTQQNAYDYKTGLAACETFIKQNRPFDAIFAHSDELALAAIHTLLSHGRRVPDDVKVVGVDNSPACLLSPVPLSSISMQLDMRGRLAVKLLMCLIDGETCKPVDVEPVLHRRQSS